MTAERRERMTETFIAVSDAMLRAHGADMPRPYYLPAVPPQTPAQYGASLAKLGKLGIVRQN